MNFQVIKSNPKRHMEELKVPIPGHGTSSMGRFPH